jgi:hypothetical protein
MKQLIHKHWTSLLGVIFILSALIYFFKYSIDQGWLNDEVKIGIGLLVGLGFAILGIKGVSNSGKQLLGEILTGLGVSLLYTTFSFAGIYYAIWEPMVVLLCMLAVTVTATLYSFRLNLRILMNIALIGALASPLILRPETDQVFTLFLYLLVINAAYFYLSILKGWTELRLVSFAGTWLMYVVYYIHFQPQVEGIWSLPYRYAVSAFIFYLLALTVSSWKNNLRFDGLNLYLGVVNAVMFGIYSMIILDGMISFSYPLAIMGVMYMGLGALVYKLSEKQLVPSLTKAFGGLFLILISVTQFGKHLDVKPLLDVYIWAAIALILLVIGMFKKLDSLKMISIAVWFIVGCYWYVVTWDTPRGEWFGVYMPFLNWGALLWMLLAALGFYYSLRVTFAKLQEQNNRFLSKVYSILSHLIVGGLLTVQVENMFVEYNWLTSMYLPLTLSITWGIYAVLLFLWGAYSRQNVFSVFGSVVWVVVSCKTLFFDLAGEDTIFKVIALFILGCISFLITFINNKWKSEKLEAANYTG